ncbi:alpha/beta fold hydrolase [Polaromonas sp.]|uniref:alpha/beta fold hydrolase n=1 Tax=Polaromonas sp. TaxID=1869339 RepID=UPI003BAC99C2
MERPVHRILLQKKTAAYSITRQKLASKNWSTTLQKVEHTGRDGVHDIGPFTFEGGGHVESLSVGYTTYGELNAARDNMLLVLPGTANTRHSADGYIGSGKAFDPGQHFVVTVDAIGAGTSSKPSDGLRGNFPQYNIRDMVHAVCRLVTTAFGVKRMAYVAGASMGAFQALEWAIHYPDMMRGVILMVPAAQTGNVFRGAVGAAKEVIKLDPGWNAGNYTLQPLAGLRAAGRLYFPWTVTDDYLESLSEPELEKELQKTVTRAAQWDAWDFIRRYEASASHDISVPFEGQAGLALARVTTRVLILPTNTDRLLPLASARQIAEGVAQSHYVEVPSKHGHLGWRPIDGAPETIFITTAIQKFIKEGETS